MPDGDLYRPQRPKPDCRNHLPPFSPSPKVGTRGLLQCKHGRHQTSLTAGTIFAYSKLTASSHVSTDGKKNPIVAVGGKGITGVELLIDADARVVQFYAITSALQGCGRKMVDAMVGPTPADWMVAVPMDWSGGFWERMERDYSRLRIL